MDPDAQPRVSLGELRRLLGRCSSRYEGGASYATFFVPFYNTMIDGGMQAEIVGIDDQPLHFTHSS
jgi:hypothetical protein